MSEKDKRNNGQWYDANYDPELLRDRQQASSLCDKLNQTPHDAMGTRQKLIDKLLQAKPVNLEILSPFMADYGNNIKFGRNCFVNHFCYFMDGAPINIGDKVFFGPYVGLYTARHPLQARARNRGLEQAQPIIIGDNCWLGGNAVVMPGVTIGPGAVIGAGAVVTHDVPANHLVVGVPAKVKGKIDQTKLFKEE